MEEYISRMEHEEFRRSMDLANKNLEDENRRQNKRLENLEENAKQNTELVTNVGRLAVNMEIMRLRQLLVLSSVIFLRSLACKSVILYYGTLSRCGI